LVPFIAGQIARRWIGAWVGRNKDWLKYVDQSSILLVVYTAFSEAVVGGLWGEVSWPTLAALVFACCLLLALSLGITALLGK
ncbi:bile acid:sodium symporter, partial [Salmonella enterica]